MKVPQCAKVLCVWKYIRATRVHSIPDSCCNDKETVCGSPRGGRPSSQSVASGFHTNVPLHDLYQLRWIKLYEKEGGWYYVWLLQTGRFSMGLRESPRGKPLVHRQLTADTPVLTSTHFLFDKYTYTNTYANTNTNTNTSRCIIDINTVFVLQIHIYKYIFANTNTNTTCCLHNRIYINSLNSVPIVPMLMSASNWHKYKYNFFSTRIHQHNSNFRVDAFICFKLSYIETKTTTTYKLNSLPSWN